MQLNQANVMPIIFASSILMFPGPICKWLYMNIHVPFLQEPLEWLQIQLNYGAPFYLCIYAMLILFFSYFWVATTFNEIQIADDLKKNGGYIPGVRPGQSTSDYLHKAMSRLTLAGAIFLTIIAVIPIMLYKQLGVSNNIAQFFGGTSILIAVGVLLNTMRQVESHLMMRHYDGFLKKGKIRGRGY
jgi:preprotein translocase subunit SecY